MAELNSDANKLTPKQAMFVKEYLIDLNGTQAAIRAGYSAKTAQEQSSRLLSNVIVSDAVKEALSKRSEKVELSAENVIQSIIQIRGMALEAEKLNDALRANELLGKHLKLFTDKTEVSGVDGAPIKQEWTVKIVDCG